jgi:hypothetical protein
MCASPLQREVFLFGVAAIITASENLNQYRNLALLKAAHLQQANYVRMHSARQDSICVEGPARNLMSANCLNSVSSSNPLEPTSAGAEQQQTDTGCNTTGCGVKERKLCLKQRD